MNRVVPRGALLALVAPQAKTGRRPFPVEAMLRIRFLRQWFRLSDGATEEALFDVPLRCAAVPRVLMSQKRHP